MKLKKCRNCQGKKLSKLFSLGKLSYTGKFPKNINTNIKKTELTLVMCNKCSLVQLNNNYNLKYLYGPDYGYRTGINKTMTEHMKNIMKNLTRKINLKKGDCVLDIASNDGTLLNFFDKKLVKFGVDPLVNKYSKFYRKIDYKISDFFYAEKIIKKLPNKKFKVITALSVFYDINDPNLFFKDINKILDDNGIFLIEHADLMSIVKQKMFDTICQEHLTYYSNKIIINMVKNNNLRVFDLRTNNINGGSTQYFICKNNAKFKTNYKTINKFVKKENIMRLTNKKTFLRFFNHINKMKRSTKKYIDKIVSQNKIIHGYGASTKGNVLLQYFGINRKHIKYIADRNPKKDNHFTPGTKIKIITESKSRRLKPNFYFVLPWHFKKEILNRERNLIKKGSKFIFPLPTFKVY